MLYSIIILLINYDSTYKKEKRSCMYFIVVFAEYAIGCIHYWRWGWRIKYIMAGI